MLTLNASPKDMKKLFCVVALITVVNLCACAQSKYWTEDGKLHSVVTFQTNAISAQDLQAVLDIHLYRCTVHRSSLTNGLATDVEISIEGKPPTSIAHLKLDRVQLENISVGQDVPVMFAVHPVGSLAGEDIYSAKKLRCFLEEGGVTTAGTAENPFYQNKSSVSYWGLEPAWDSGTTFKFMQGYTKANEQGAKIEIRVRFQEF